MSAATWPAAYIGLPFATGGRDRHGLDCWGLVRLVLADLRGLDVPDMHDAADRDRAELLALGRAAWREIAIEEVREGDVLVFRALPGDPLHAGIALDAARMLHARPEMGVVVEQWRGPMWRGRLMLALRPEVAA